MSDMKAWPSREAIVLHNVTCAYCGQPFDAVRKKTREHVIGRNFVPKGCFDRQWNLILRACTVCNMAKADLEDDIAAISMMPDLRGKHAIDDPRLPAEVARRAQRSRSRRTGRLLADSKENISVNAPFGAATFTFGFTAPAQVTDDRLFQLARYHFDGFFYWITYNRDARRGGFFQGGFFPLFAKRRADWGSPAARWFMNVVRTWDGRVHAIAADGFFAILVRRHPQGLPVWAWATEWNYGIRVAGFAGDEDAIRTVASECPEEPMTLLHQAGGDWLRYRTDTALPDTEDDLFVFESLQDENSATEPSS